VTDKTRIVIIDDHPMFREGLKAIIARDHRYRVVGEADRARTGLARARELRPQVVIVDISLPDQSGIELTRDLRRHLPESRVLIVSMHARIDYIVDAFQAGALGYVVKDAASDRLLKGLETVSRGGYYLDRSVSHEVVEKLMKSPAPPPSATGGYDALTPREQEVMRLLAEGFRVREIAARLFISPKTVENHRANLMRKLDIHSTIDLVRYAARLGLIDLDLWKE
jgi:DNA-binding NarL/FixJ family response regulator